MTDQGKSRRLTLGWRKILLGIGCAGIAVGGVCLARGPVERAIAPAATGSAAASRTARDSSSSSESYSSERVAVFADNRQGVTREELGEYLIARFGEKIEHLINHRLIEDACRARGIEVTAKEVEQKLAEDLSDLNIDRSRFVKEFLKARGKTLYEWKEDHLRPELMMLKLCRDQIVVTPEEVRQAYEARYGEKVDCRAIAFPAEKKVEAEATYAQLSSSEQAFAEAARKQPDTALAINEGKLKAFGRHTLDNQKMEDEAFALQPGQVSPLIPIAETGGYIVLKCDQRFPANTTVPFEKVSAELSKEVLERKSQKMFHDYFAELRKNAKVELCLERKPNDEGPPKDFSRNPPAGEAKNRIVATLYDGQVQLTREDLGNFLIKRYGVASLQFLVNRRIIENACEASNIVITDSEVEAAFLMDCAKYEQERQKHPEEASASKEQTKAPEALSAKDRFIKDRLAPNRTSVFQYKEDIIRPRLMLARLCRDRVKVEEQDVQAAIEAYYGEQVQCRMILWPDTSDKSKIVLHDYEQIRDNPRAFDEKARTQPCLTLARKDGWLENPIGHHTTGNELLEQAAFSLREGEVSSVIGTPEGLVVLKCEHRVPARKIDDLEKVRAELMQEVLEKKTQAYMPLYFAELQKQAHPRLLLDDPNRAVDLKEEVSQELGTQMPSP